MAKNAITDYSQTAADNTDIGGNSLLGSSSPRNLLLGLRELMKQLADWNAGTSPIDDTASSCDPTDTTKIFRFDGVNVPTATTRVIDAEALFDLAEEAEDIIALLDPQFVNYLSGYTLSNNATDATNDINIAAGACADSTNTNLIKRASSITKRLDAAWAVGTGQGGLDTGTIADGTYHVYAIKRLDTDVDDIIFSTSASAPTLPADYTIYRRIGSIIRSSGAILAFSQNGDEFLLNTPVEDVDVTNQGNTGVLRTLTVPSGIKVNALIRVAASNSTILRLIISSPDVADVTPSSTGSPGADLGNSDGTDGFANLSVRTNTSRQVRSTASNSSTELMIATYGWIDRRGK